VLDVAAQVRIDEQPLVAQRVVDACGPDSVVLARILMRTGFEEPRRLALYLLGNMAQSELKSPQCADLALQELAGMSMQEVEQFWRILSVCRSVGPRMRSAFLAVQSKLTPLRSDVIQSAWGDHEARERLRLRLREEVMALHGGFPCLQQAMAAPIAFVGCVPELAGFTSSERALDAPPITALGYMSVAWAARIAILRVARETEDWTPAGGWTQQARRLAVSLRLGRGGYVVPWDRTVRGDELAQIGSTRETAWFVIEIVRGSNALDAPALAMVCNVAESNWTPEREALACALGGIRDPRWVALRDYALQADMEETRRVKLLRFLVDSGRHWGHSVTEVEAMFVTGPTVSTRSR